MIYRISIIYYIMTDIVEGYKYDIKARKGYHIVKPTGCDGFTACMNKLIMEKYDVVSYGLTHKLDDSNYYVNEQEDHYRISWYFKDYIFNTISDINVMYGSKHLKFSINGIMQPEFTMHKQYNMVNGWANESLLIYVPKEYDIEDVSNKLVISYIGYNYGDCDDRSVLSGLSDIVYMKDCSCMGTFCIKNEL